MRTYRHLGFADIPALFITGEHDRDLAHDHLPPLDQVLDQLDEVELDALLNHLRHGRLVLEDAVEPRARARRVLHLPDLVQAVELDDAGQEEVGELLVVVPPLVIGVVLLDVLLNVEFSLQHASI